MDMIVLECACGTEMRLPKSALGNSVECICCHMVNAITPENTRPLVDAEEDAEQPVDPAPASAEPRVLSQAERDVELFIEHAPEPPLPAAFSVEAASLPLLPPRESGKDAASTSKGPVPKTGECCARCGRPFRGPWDRHEIGLETFCNICANLAENFEVGKIQPKEPPQSALMKEIANQYSWAQLEQNYAPKKAPPGEHLKRIRGMLITGAIGAVAMLAIYFWPESLTPHFAPPTATAEEPSQAMTYVIMGLRALLAVATQTLAIYLTLNWANKLPNERLWANLFVVTVVGIACYGLSFLPFAGWLLGWILLYSLYELRVSEFVMLIVFTILARILSWAAGMFLFGAIGMAFG